MTLSTILVINGPNLNLLGLGEPGLYGTDTLASIEALLQKLGDELGLNLEFFQSNHEGAIVDTIQAARGRVAFILIKSGAYTHT